MVLTIALLPLLAAQTHTCQLHILNKIKLETYQFILQDGNEQAGVGSIKVSSSNSDSGSLKRYPDKPASSTPSGPVSLRYVVEHRSALNGKTMTVRGVIVRTVFPTTTKNSAGDQVMAYSQPKIIIADNLLGRRDRNLDLTVLLREGDRVYKNGQKVKLKVMIDASDFALVMHKVY